ncbi:hypothetical protein SODALDRAFT_328498 [Sodiomyces alkalinus F11]|uniref:Protein kinase domain-containing protein n=1 Tax=Sodiomyces alkalinus (strain CBS 110278 / VKM F-3762 / F11) TaxID=1314773 RepID=A0A3N2PNN2_SODAK|nr:hypothetical protein SODALDRAFT_328498 [Sodiomyces alkalinus F11]ROT36125.1 hypothetical protein SODALDRAFT_328498 [Sodiomyces alkalinus F11]
MASCPPFQDYQVGQVLTLSVIPKHGKNCAASTIRARIRKLQYPRTLSRCMIVDLLGEDYPDHPVFLKLYDSRFSEQLRSDNGIDPWTRDAEKEYIDAVETGAARQFIHNLRTIPDFEEGIETWDDGQLETYLTNEVHKLFDAETTAYDALRDIQGKLVPRLIARVHLALSLPNVVCMSRTDAAELLHIKGILLQYVDGFPLSEVQDHAPQSEWQGIVDQAVAIVQAVGDHGILNTDVRPDSFMVQRDRSGCYRVFMIDFGMTRLRGWNESDRDWGKAKLYRDEEGAVGFVMKKRLAREGFELRYEYVDRYREWASDDEE